MGPGRRKGGGDGEVFFLAQPKYEYSRSQKKYEWSDISPKTVQNKYERRFEIPGMNGRQTLVGTGGGWRPRYIYNYGCTRRGAGLRDGSYFVPIDS